MITQRLAILMVAVVLLPACGLLKNWFGGEPKPGEPNELVEFEPTLETDQIWSVGVGDGIERGIQQLRPAFRRGRLFVADYEGVLVAIDASDGDRIWRNKTDLPFSGGPGVGEELVFVGTENGEVHAFRADSGEPVWITRVSSEVLAPPVEADGIVVIRSIDGRVYGVDARNGRRIWVYDRGVPLLTLRGNAKPVLRAGMVYLGYDAGEVVALQLEDGSLAWEQVVTMPEGRSELDRLADIDGQMVMVASDLLVSSYKNRIASLAADSGRLLWFKEVSSAKGVSVARTNLATSDKEGHVWMLDRRNGATLWKQDQLENRNLTRPAFYGDYVVVGDFEGYLHWLNADDGTFVARTKVGGDGFTGAPLVVGDTLYVYTRKGKLAAFRAGSEV